MSTFRTAPTIGYSLVKDGDKRTPTNTVIYHSYQPTTGRYLNLIDLDNHTDQQDAGAAKEVCKRQFKKISWHPSQGKRSRLVWHGYVESNKPLPHGKIYDQDGRHIGELLIAWITTATIGGIRPNDGKPTISAANYTCAVDPAGCGGWRSWSRAPCRTTRSLLTAP